MSEESWKTISGFDDYEISNLGRVKSNRGKTQKILKPRVFGKGYHGVTLCKNGIQKKRYIHQLVLEEFVSSRPTSREVCHGDGDRTNNRLNNLRWDTKPGNHSDKYVHGTMMMGSGHTNSKLSESDVKEIRSLYVVGGITQKDLGKRFGVSQGTVWDILSRKTWNHIPNIERR